MGIKPVPTKIFMLFLKSKGIVYIKTQSSHDVFDNPQTPLPWPVVISMKYKDTPLLDIHTTLENIGISKKNLRTG